MQQDETLGWRVEKKLVFEKKRGRIVVAALTIRPKGSQIPPGGITARLLRKIKIDGNYGIRVILEPPLPQRATRPLSARPDDAFYAELAGDYATALRASRNPKPIAQLAHARGVSITQARSWVNRARRNGFLTETARGRAAGELTPKAKQILRRSK